jgi:hypothetical protein
MMESSGNDDDDDYDAMPEWIQNDDDYDDMPVLIQYGDDYEDMPELIQNNVSAGLEEDIISTLPSDQTIEPMNRSNAPPTPSTPSLQDSAIMTPSSTSSKHVCEEQCASYIHLRISEEALRRRGAQGSQLTDLASHGLSEMSFLPSTPSSPTASYTYDSVPSAASAVSSMAFSPLPSPASASPLPSPLALSLSCDERDSLQL